MKESLILIADSSFEVLRAGMNWGDRLLLGSPLRLAAASPPAQPMPWASAPQGPPELQHYCGSYRSAPISPKDLAHPAQQKLAEASPLFDLPKDRPHEGLAPSIQTPTGLGPEGVARSATDRPAGGRPRGAAGTARPWSWRLGGMSGAQPSAARAVTFVSLK